MGRWFREKKSPPRLREGAGGTNHELITIQDSITY